MAMIFPLQSKFEENLVKLNSMNEAERKSAYEYFREILRMRGLAKPKLIEFLLQRFEAVSLRVQVILILLFIENNVKEAIPAYTYFILKRKEEREIILKIIDTILKFEDEDNYAKVAVIITMGNEYLQKLILTKILSIDKTKWIKFCWSIRKIPMDSRIKLLEIIAKEDFHKISKFVLEAYTLKPSPEQKVFLFECFQELKIIERFIQVLALAALDTEKLKKSVQALQKIDHNLLNHFLTALYTEDDSTRFKIIELLEYIGDQRLEEPFRKLFEYETNEKIISKAIKVFSEFANADEVLIIGRKLLNERDSRIRANAVEALEKAGEYALEIFINLLKDPNNRVRANAAKAISKGYRDRGHAVLLNMLKSDDPKMKASALWAFGEIGDQRTESTIIEYIDDPDELVRKNAIIALNKLLSEKEKSLY